MHTLIEAGARVVCVTDGPHGAVATDGEALYSCPSLPCIVTDSTGAGDAFGTAMTWALLRGKDLPTALKAGTINATSVVGSVGAQKGLLTETQIQTELSRTDIHVAVEPF
jgi:sugar/nucleoside kinase (ribokinase family)